MNRSVDRRRFAVRGTRSGELVVGWFSHPTRGRVRCPATPLVAASLRGRGFHVREEHDLPAPVDGAADGVLFAASYLDRAGGAVGMAVATHHTDQSAIRAAREVVLSWSTAWRSRRLVVTAAESCRDGEDPTSATCPHVDVAHQELGRFVRRGDRVVLVGHSGRPVTASLAAASAEVVLVESVDEVAGLRLDPDRVSYLVVPGTVVEYAMRVVAALRARYPRLRGPHPDDLCHAASDRLSTVRAVAGACDQVFVLGAATAPDTADLVDTARHVRNPVHVVDGLERIQPSWLAAAESIGIVTAPSAPPPLLHDVVDALSGMGPMSVVRRRTTTGPLVLSGPVAQAPQMSVV